MATKAQKVKVGIFLIASAALIGAGILVLSGFERGEEVPYVIEFDESVLGLGTGSVVVYLGVDIGKVKEISVTEDNRVRVVVGIDPNKLAPEKEGLHEGVKAHLTLYSIATGIMCVSLEGGDNAKPLLPPWAEIPSERSVFTSFTSQLGELMDNLSAVVQQVYSGLEGMKPGELMAVVRHADNLINRADEFVKTANSTLTDVKTDLQGGVQNFSELTSHLQELAKNFDALVKVVKEKIEPLKLAETEADVRLRFKAVSESFEQTAQSFDTAVKVVANKSDNVEVTLRETMRTLNETLEALRDLATYLKEDPSAILRGRGKPAGGP